MAMILFIVQFLGFNPINQQKLYITVQKIFCKLDSSRDGPVNVQEQGRDANTQEEYPSMKQ